MKKKKTVKGELIKIKNPPYSLFGSTPCPSSYKLTFKVGGLRQMLKGLKADDAFVVEVFSGFKATEYSFIK